MGKLTTLAEAAEIVTDGATVGFGGLMLNGAPMAFVRELARRQVRDLTVVVVAGGMPVDWLVAAGCVRRVISSLVSFDGFGLAPHHRAAVESGRVLMEEYSEHTLICRLQAAAHRLPFVPTKAGLGTDMVRLHPDTTRTEVDPVTGEHYVACTPLRLDVAVVHVHDADDQGNARVLPKLMWMDTELIRAADTVVVTAERIAPTASFRDRPEATSHPRFMVHAVVQARWGAYPTSCFPEYDSDSSFLRDYQAAASSPETWAPFWRERITGPPDQAAFLNANGGARTIFERGRSFP